MLNFSEKGMLEWSLRAGLELVRWRRRFHLGNNTAGEGMERGRVLEVESGDFRGPRDFLWVLDFMSHEGREVRLAGIPVPL